MSGFDFSLLSKGGPMMAVILLMAAIMVVLLVERTLYLHRGQIRAKAFIEGIKNTLQKRRLVEALTICEETPGPVAAVVKAALLHTKEGAEKMRHAVQDAAIVEMPALERRLGAIAAIAQIAPLVGLLGTVLGMITSFHAFMLGGQYATANTLAGGLWQALAATAGGLLVGIPAHLAYHFLRGRVRSIVRDVEWSANEIMEYLISEYEAGGEGRREQEGREEQEERERREGREDAAGKPGGPEGGPEN
jgi:biopolymer transport protein ExbB